MQPYLPNDWFKSKGYSATTLTHIFKMQCNLYVFSPLHIYIDTNYMSYQTLSSFCSSCTFARTKFQVFDQNWKLNVNHISQWKDDLLHVTQSESICNVVLRSMNRWVERRSTLEYPCDFWITITSNLRYIFYLAGWLHKSLTNSWKYQSSKEQLWLKMF